MAEATRRRPPTREELQAHRKAHEEVARKLRAHGITHEQLCEEALQIVRAIREASGSGRTVLSAQDMGGIDSRRS